MYEKDFTLVLSINMHILVFYERVIKFETKKITYLADVKVGPNLWCHFLGDCFISYKSFNSLDIMHFYCLLQPYLTDS
jgi:hypothetical protein